MLINSVIQLFMARHLSTEKKIKQILGIPNKMHCINFSTLIKKYITQKLSPGMVIKLMWWYIFHVDHNIDLVVYKARWADPPVQDYLSSVI